ncbi:MAG: SMC-Scp complex subunit ScpB [Pseudomonadales bacterium]
METTELKAIIEASLLAAGRPLSVRELGNLFDPKGRPDNAQLRTALQELGEDCEGRAYELKEVGSGFRFQVKSRYGTWVSRLWEEKPPRYSRALLETLALIAYKQPITRGEVEDVRGVAVSTNIIRTLLERNWVRVVGHRDVPGKPALYSTTKEFLDYFNLKNLNELPNLADIKEIAQLNPELELEAPVEGRSIEMPVEDSESANDEQAAEQLSEDDMDVIVSEAIAEAGDTNAIVEQVEAVVNPVQEEHGLADGMDEVDPDADFSSLPN